MQVVYSTSSSSVQAENHFQENLCLVRVSDKKITQFVILLIMRF